MSIETYTVKNKNKRKQKLNLQNKAIKSTKRSKIENIRSLLNDNKLNFVYEIITDYLNQYGEDCYIIHEQAKYFYLIGEIEYAREEYIKNIQNNGKNKYYSMYELSKIEKEQKNNDRAISLLKEIIDSDHEEKFHAKNELAKIYFEESKYELAKNLFYEVINVDDDSEIFNNIKESIYIYLVQAEINIENFDKAKELIEKYQDNLKEFEYKLLQGQLELHMKNYNKAQKIFYDIVNNCNEGINKALYYLVEIEYKFFNYEKVIEICNQLLVNGYNNEDTLISLATTYLRMKNTKEARKCVDLLKEKGFLGDIDILMGKIYFYENEYEKSIEYLNRVSSENTTIYEDILYTKMCSYIKLEKYDDAYVLLKEFIDADIEGKFYNKIILIKLYLEKQLKLNTIPLKNSYTAEQIKFYDKENAIKHIKRHESEDEDKPVHSIFNEDVDIEEIYYYCKYMISENNFYKNTFLDVYIIPYKNVGTLENKTLDNLKVVTIPNTDQIIAIYPFNIPVFEDKKVKKKEFSRIDKFNQKYGIK